MDNYLRKLQKLVTFGYALMILSGLVLLFEFLGFSPSINWVVVGIAVVAFFAGLIISGESDTDKYKYLKQNGVQIQAKVLYISLQAAPTQLGQRSTAPWQAPYLANFQIVCEGIDPTNQSKKNYLSDKLTSRPDVKISPNTTFRVIVDKKDSNFYWVDLSDVTFDSNFPSVSFSLLGNPSYRSYDGINYQKV